MNDTSMTRKSDPKYDEDLVNKRYVDKEINASENKFQNEILDCYNYTNEMVNKSACTVYSQNQYHTGGRWAVIRFKITNSYFLGDGFELTTYNSVLVKKDMRGVVISANMSLASGSYSYSGDLYVYQFRNGTIINTAQVRGVPGSGYLMIALPSYLFMDVRKDDEFVFGHYTGNDTDTFTTMDDNGTYMTIREL